jgi:hypothetical protein
MLFNWREYLALAQYLQGQGSSQFTQEAGFRCAVSRAYYAAFCHARNYARDQHGFVLTYSARDHTLVRQHFKGRSDTITATALDDLRQWRNLCDYDDTVSNLSSLLTSAISAAQAIFSRLP